MTKEELLEKFETLDRYTTGTHKTHRTYSAPRVAELTNELLAWCKEQENHEDRVFAWQIKRFAELVESCEERFLDSTSQGENVCVSDAFFLTSVDIITEAKLTLELAFSGMEDEG